MFKEQQSRIPSGPIGEIGGHDGAAGGAGGEGRDGGPRGATTRGARREGARGTRAELGLEIEDNDCRYLLSHLFTFILS